MLLALLPGQPSAGGLSIAAPPVRPPFALLPPVAGPGPSVAVVLSTARSFSRLSVLLLLGTLLTTLLALLATLLLLLVALALLAQRRLLAVLLTLLVVLRGLSGVPTARRDPLLAPELLLGTAGLEAP